jgi:hypothetical protein
MVLDVNNHYKIKIRKIPKKKVDEALKEHYTNERLKKESFLTL